MLFFLTFDSALGGSGTSTHFLDSHDIPKIKRTVLYFFKASHIIYNENNQKQMQTIFL